MMRFTDELCLGELLDLDFLAFELLDAFVSWKRTTLLSDE